LGKVVSWTAQAWTMIQDERADWSWMAGEFSGSVVAGTTRYSPTALGITARFASWVVDRFSYRPMTLQTTSLTVADEAPIQQVSWPYWRTLYGRGAQTIVRPRFYAISPAKEVCLGPTPDVPYTLRGEYRKSAQTLALDTDIPELPDAFHMVIAWKAIMLLHAHDEGVQNVQLATANYNMLFGALVRAALPEIRIVSDPIA
jgi:hypothetical protein